jgi:hypothetical protein
MLVLKKLLFYRRGRFAVGGGGGPTVEGWGVRRDGTRVDTTGPSGGTLRPALIGGLVQSWVGVVLPGRDDARVRARIAARLELAASSLPSGAAARVREAADADPLFVVGGIELATGLEATIWFDPRPLAGRRTPGIRE